MKRDMDLVRLILLEIEDAYRSTAIYNLAIEGYDTETVAYQGNNYSKRVANGYRNN